MYTNFQYIKEKFQNWNAHLEHFQSLIFQKFDGLCTSLKGQLCYIFYTGLIFLIKL